MCGSPDPSRTIIRSDSPDIISGCTPKRLKSCTWQRSRRARQWRLLSWNTMSLCPPAGVWAWCPDACCRVVQRLLNGLRRCCGWFYCCGKKRGFVCAESLFSELFRIKKKKHLTNRKIYAIVILPRIGRVFFMRPFISILTLSGCGIEGGWNAVEPLCFCRGRVSLR